MIDNEQVEEIILILDDKLSKTVRVLKEDFAAVRAGRANPHILDKITVDYYGAQTPINQTSNISVQEGRCLVISPWDASLLKAIEKSLQIANLGVNPTNDGKVIRRELSKQIRKMGEDAKIAVRNIRRDALESLKKLKTDKIISEDEYASVEKDVEKYVADAVAQTDAAVTAKEKEIMTV